MVLFDPEIGHPVLFFHRVHQEVLNPLGGKDAYPDRLPGGTMLLRAMLMRPAVPVKASTQFTS